MSNFQYQVLQKDGSVADGETGGRNRAEAMRTLNEKGFRVLSLEEIEASPTETKEEEQPKSPRRRKREMARSEHRLSSKQLIQFTEEMSDMIVAGVQLDAALESIAKRSESEALRNVAGICYAKVRDGFPLASALRSSSDSFGDLYCNLVSAGEVSGALGEILQRQVSYLTTLAELRGKLATAMVYPAFLVVSGFAVGSMFVFFLIPKLRRLVESTGGELPPVARFMVSLGDFLRGNWVGLIVALVVVIVGIFIYFQRPGAKLMWDREKLKLPLFGRLLITRFNVQYVETLSNLLSNGLPLVKALELVKGTTSNLHARNRIEEMTARVSEGALLHRTMEKAGIFESGLIDMVRIGEDTGQLASSITKAGTRLDREFSRSIDRIASIIQPAIILVMSVVVGVIAYMMISAIYETISILRSR